MKTPDEYTDDGWTRLSDYYVSTAGNMCIELPEGQGLDIRIFMVIGLFSDKSFQHVRVS
jgi:hypothetical protein